MFYAICVGPYDRIRPMLWVDMFRAWDVKRWTIAKERGKGGYEHWQVRIMCSGKYSDFFDWMQERTGGLLHVEESQTWSDYERKEGHFYTSEDTARIRHQRFGKLRWYQLAVLRRVRKSDDREIVVWVDEDGNIGKSWLVSHLFETGQAYVLNPLGTAKSLVQDVCSMYKNGGPSILVINIPRTWKWTKDLLVAIETIKDGLLSDPRYSNTTINRDLKILVTTNDYPKVDALSYDRWAILVMTEMNNLILEQKWMKHDGKPYTAVVGEWWEGEEGPTNETNGWDLM